MRSISTLVRRDEILRLASEIRQRFGPLMIEEAAAENDVVLVRTEGAVGRDAGFAYIHFTRKPSYVESLSRPEDPLLVWGSMSGDNSDSEPIRSIVINTNSGISECEVFWHEWYHIFHSPLGIQRSEQFEHRFSTEAALHNQEERRADEFAAAVIVGTEHECSTIAELIEQFGISERLAARAIQFTRSSLTIQDR